MTADGIEDACILVVDDQWLNRAVIKATLTGAGFVNLLFADDGAEALAAAERNQVECVLLDVMMPGMDGWTVCRTLRDQPRYRRIPIIIQTALTSSQDRRTAFKVGASDIIAKPLDPQELVARVRVHVTNQRFADRLLADRERVEAEMLDARSAAEALLPEPQDMAALVPYGLGLDYHFRPCSSLGGDYWTVWPTRSGRIGLFLGDVSGHGVSAALRASALNALLMPPLPFDDDPLRLMAHLDRRLYSHSRRAGFFVAAGYLLYEPGSRVFTTVGAGLRNGLVVRADGTVDSFRLSGLPLGLIADLSRTTDAIACAPGDTLVLYTDALVETTDAEGEPVTEDRFRAWLAALLSKPGPARDDRRHLASAIADAFLCAVRRDLADDLLIVSALVM